MVDFWCSHGDRNTAHKQYGFTAPGVKDIGSLCARELVCPVDGKRLPLSAMRAFLFYQCNYKIDGRTQAGKDYRKEGRVEGSNYVEIECQGEEAWAFLTVKTWPL